MVAMQPSKAGTSGTEEQMGDVPDKRDAKGKRGRQLCKGYLRKRLLGRVCHWRRLRGRHLAEAAHTE